MFFHPFFLSPPGPLSVTQPAKGTTFAVSMFPSDTAGLCCFTTAGLCGCPQGIPTSRRGSHVTCFLSRSRSSATVFRRDQRLPVNLLSPRLIRETCIIAERGTCPAPLSIRCTVLCVGLMLTTPSCPCIVLNPAGLTLPVSESRPPPSSCASSRSRSASQGSGRS